MMSTGADRRVMLAASVLAFGLMAACGSAGAGNALDGGDPTDRWSAPVPVGHSMTYGALVLTTRSRPVRLVSASLVPFPHHSYPKLRITATVVGPERGGKVLGIGSPELRDRTVGPGTRLENTTLQPGRTGTDYGTEVLFELTPAEPGEYWFEAARVTYELDGRRQTQVFPAYLLLCAGKLKAPCDSKVLSDAIAQEG